MNCDRAQRILSTTPRRGDPRHRFPPLWATSHFWAILHATHCSDCAAFLTRLGFLDAQIDRWKADTDAAPLPADLHARTTRLIGDALRDRAASTLLNTADTPNRRKQIMPPFTLAAVSFAAIAFAAIGSVATFCLLEQNRPLPQATVLSPMTIAVAQPVIAPLHIPPVGAARIRNVHVRTWTRDANGNFNLEEEMWYENGRWRKEGVYGSRLIVGGEGYPHDDGPTKQKIYGTYYRYDASQHRVISMSEMGKQRTDFTLNSILPWEANQATVVGSETIGGQEAVEYEFRPDNTTRWQIWVDRATGLPARYIRSTRDGDSASWVTTDREEYEFNRSLNQSLFDPNTLADEGWRG